MNGRLPKPIEWANRIFQLLVAGDFEGILELVDANPEYHNPDDAAEAGSRLGRKEVEEALQRMSEAFDWQSLESLRWAAKGNTEALVDIKGRVVGKLSGAPVDQYLCSHIVFKDGLAARFEWFRDWEAAAASVGLNETEWELSP